MQAPSQSPPPQTRLPPPRKFSLTPAWRGFFKGSGGLVPSRVPSIYQSGIYLILFISAFSRKQMSTSLLTWCLLSHTTTPVFCALTWCSLWSWSTHLNSSDMTHIPSQTNRLPTRWIRSLPLPSTHPQPRSTTLLPP